MKYVVFYESAEDVVTKAPAHFAAHRSHWDAFRDQGTLVMIGPFANAQEHGSMAIFTTREAAEEFVRNDPFVLNGVVKKWEIREWSEALFGDSGRRT